MIMVQYLIMRSIQQMLWRSAENVLLTFCYIFHSGKNFPDGGGNIAQTSGDVNPLPVALTKYIGMMLPNSSTADALTAVWGGLVVGDFGSASRRNFFSLHCNRSRQVQRRWKID